MYRATCLMAVSFALLLCGGISSPPAFADDSGADDSTQLTAPIIAGNNALAIDLYGRLKERPGNLFFSPYSISSALAMTYAGARGETATEMAKALQFGSNDAGFHRAFGRATQVFNGAGEDHGYQLSVANAMWLQQGHSLLADFSNSIKSNYRGTVRPLDFRSNADAARRTVNAWVARETAGKINDLLPPGVLTPDTRLVLTNTIYFKSKWDKRFDQEKTRPAPFRNGRRVKVPLMHQTAKYPYLQDDGFQVVRIPYANFGLSMIVLLPDEVDGLPGLEQKLPRIDLAKTLGKLDWSEVVLSLPKFKMASDFKLRPTLAALGMKQAFSEGADFSGIDGQRDLFISDVIHKACVDVDEEGTEAAAATAALHVKSDDPVPKTEKVTFRADHPFVFLIRENKTGAILFVGRVVEPNGPPHPAARE